jgi:hypothetical protein
MAIIITLAIKYMQNFAAFSLENLQIVYDPKFRSR